MKKQITRLSIYFFLLVAVAGFTAFTYQEKNKGNKKEQAQDKKQKDQGNQDKVKDRGNEKEKPNQGNQKDNRDKDEMNRGKGNNDEKERGNNDNDINERGNAKNNGKNAEYGYNWDRENFKDRDKLRKQEKVTICHKFNREDEPAVTINVSANALKAHLNHGDVQGDCPEVDNTRYSNSFLDRRRDYYNLLQEEQEQVLYSRSILDYALQRLSSSRLQLATMQTNNVAPEEIERKRVMVVDLEQNVSTLETLLGVAAGLLANKWAGN